MSGVISQHERTQREREALHGGGGRNGNTSYTGGGGGDSGHFDEKRTRTYQERLGRCRLVVGLSMVSVTALFIALTYAYLARQNNVVVNESGERIGPWLQLTLPPLLMVNTWILLLSSVTVELARRNLRRQVLFAPLAEIPGIKAEPNASFPCLATTLILAVGFLAGQFAAWRMMQHEGFYLARNPSSAFFYLLTGAHAFHLSVGILVLLYAAASHFVARTLETRCLIVDVTSWYWHFMAVLWIYIYALLYFAR
jgi:cytochrome c oxidase subunit 3